jgi:hypothetical protein
MRESADEYHGERSAGQREPTDAHELPCRHVVCGRLAVGNGVRAALLAVARRRWPLSLGRAAAPGLAACGTDSCVTAYAGARRVRAANGTSSCI